MSVIVGHQYPGATLIGNFGGRPVYAVIADGTTSTTTTSSTTTSTTSTTTSTTTTTASDRRLKRNVKRLAVFS